MPLNPTKEQTDWAFYNDGTEAGSVIIGTKNTNPSKGDLANDTIYLVRFGIEETAGDNWNNPALQLQYNHNAGGLTNVTTTSSVIKAVDSANLTDGGDTTQRMTSFTFVTPNLGISEDGDGSSTSDMNTNGWEVLFTIQIISGDVSDGDTIELQITDTEDGFDVYNQANPVITVEKAAGGLGIPIAMYHYLHH